VTRSGEWLALGAALNSPNLVLPAEGSVPNLPHSRRFAEKVKTVIGNLDSVEGSTPVALASPFGR
jgi:hypothetical protein